MKTQNYSAETMKLANLFDALSNPARLHIIEMLAINKICTAGEISDSLPLSRSTVSEHFSKLKNSGLICCNPSGICLNYEINTIRLIELRKLYCQFLNKIFIENEIAECH
jgi:DNA-binding transcriptional ArsR family regulator